MEIEFKPIAQSELDRFNEAEDRAYSAGPSPEDRAAFNGLFDFDRSLAAFDGKHIVGGACYYRLGLSVPGGDVPAAGVTYVFTAPTHRRRGILTGLMRRQLDAMHREGIAVGALHAAESSIYGRFGYGPAAHTEVLEIERSHGALRSSGPPAGDFRLINDDEASRLFPGVYERYRSNTPGLFSRDAGWWNLRLRTPGQRSGAPGWMKVVYEREGKAVGYAIYAVRSNWQNAIPMSRMQVEEIVSADPESYAALWRYLLNVDVVKTIRAFASSDPALWWMLSDPRRLSRSVRDGLWVRLVDVAAALASRRYSADGAIHIQVEDDFCPWNTGTYGLEVSGGAASCEQVDAEPDLSLSASALAALYLGGASAQTLAAAGLIQEHQKGALTLADQMFSWHCAPMTSAPEPLT